MESTSNYAICILRPDGGSGVNGCVKFVQPQGGKVRVVAEISGLTEGDHGFHVHEFGNLLEGCKTAGAHFNPHGKDHGGPQDEERHVGDMGNVTAGSDGVAKLDYEDPMISLTGEHSIIGRSVVCHKDPDDHGKGGHDDSKTTGHAGARLACGTIGLSGPFDNLDCKL
mgnify:CR=1 FL=1